MEHAVEPRTDRPSVVLAMIVRDEAAVIERCLDSVRPVIDGWVIVDTGSLDDTPARIESTLRGIPGRLEHRPWVDFGHNRSELMDLARGEGTHLLLLDADMTLRVEGELPPLTADAHLLRHDGDPAYWIPRLVRSDREWRYEGATHEHLATPGDHTQERLACWVVEHHADGGSRADKFTRDRDLLQAELARRPDDPRTTFYLAQTLRDLGDREGALELYRRRVALGGWVEEVFYSRLQEGLLLADHDWDAAVEALLDAWHLRPGRAEPLLHLARGHAARGRYAAARHFAELGLPIPEPTEDLLFVHPEAYRWALRFERAIAAYHCGDPTVALSDNERLLVDGVPDWIEPWVRHNLAWCRRALGVDEAEDRARLAMIAGDGLPRLDELLPVTRRIALEVPTPPGWSCFNPTVAREPSGGYLAVARTANYRFGPGGVYELAEGEGSEVIRTVNRLVALDDDLRVRESGPPLPAEPEGPPLFQGRVRGVEDVRVVAHGGRWWGLGTVRDRDPDECCEIALVDLGPVDGPLGSSDRGRVLRRQVGPDPGRHEKNWMPFTDGGRLLALYGCDPVVVVALQTTEPSGPADVVSSRPGPPGAGGFRGGSQGMAVEGGWLFVVHEVVPGGDLDRVYGHRLVRLVRDGDGYALDAVTAPFFLDGPDVEFCAGMAPGPEGARTVLAYGRRDARAALWEVPTSALSALLVPLRPTPDVGDGRPEG